MSRNNNTNNNNDSPWTGPPQWAKEKPKTNNNKDDDDQQQQQQHATSSSRAWSKQPKDTFTNNPTKVASWDSWVKQRHAAPEETARPVPSSNEKKSNAPVATVTPVSSGGGSMSSATTPAPDSTSTSNHKDDDDQQQPPSTSQLCDKAPASQNNGWVKLEKPEWKSSRSWSTQQARDSFANNWAKVAGWDRWVKQQQQQQAEAGPVQPSTEKKSETPAAAAASRSAPNSSATTLVPAKVNTRSNENVNNNDDNNGDQRKQQPTSEKSAKINSWDTWVKQHAVSTDSNNEGWITPRRAAAKRADEKRKQDEAQESWMAKVLLRREKLQDVESDASDGKRQNQSHRVMQHPHFIQRILKYTKITDYRVPIKLAHVSSSWEETIWHFGTVHLIWKKIFQASVEEVADDTIRSAKLKINQLHWKRNREYFYNNVSGGQQRQLNKNHDSINNATDDATDYSDDDSIHGDDRDELRTVIRELQRAKRRTNSTLAIDTTQAMHRSSYKKFLTTTVPNLDTVFSPDVDRLLKYNKKYDSTVAQYIDKDVDETTTPKQRKERFQTIDADFYGEVACKRRLLATHPVPPSTAAIAAAAALAEKKAQEKELKRARKSKNKKRYCSRCGGYHTVSAEEDDDDESSDGAEKNDTEQEISDQYRDAVFSWCPPFALWNCRIDAAKMIPKLVELRHGFGERILLEGFFHEAFPDCRRYDANAEKRNAEDQETGKGNEHDEEVIFQRLLAEQQLKEDELSKKEKKNKKQEKVNEDDDSSDDDESSDDDDVSATSSSNSSSIPAFVGQQSIFVVNVEDRDGSSLNQSRSRQHHATNFGIIRAFLSALRSEPELVLADDENENNNNLISFLPAAVPHIPSSAFIPMWSMNTRNRCRLALVKAIHQKLIEISSSDRFDAEEVETDDALVLFPASEYNDGNEEEEENEKNVKKKPLVNFFTHDRMKKFCEDSRFQRGGYIFTSIIGQSSPAVFDFLLNCAFREFLWSDSRKKIEKSKKLWSSFAAESQSGASNNNKNIAIESTNGNTTKAEFLASIISHPEICLGTPSDLFSFSAEIRKNLGDNASATTTIDPLLCSALSGNVEIFEHILTTYPLLQQRFMFGSYDTLVKVFTGDPAVPTTQQSRFTVKPYPFVPLSSYTNNKDNDGYAVSTDTRAPSREEETQKRKNQETMTAVFNSTRTNPYITLTFLKLVDLMTGDIHKTVRDANDKSSVVGVVVSPAADIHMTSQILHYSSLLDPLFDENNARNSCSTNSGTASTPASRQRYKNQMLLLDNSHYKRRIAQFKRIFDRIVDLAFQHDKRPELAMEPLFWREPLIAIFLRLDPLISSQWVSAASAEKFNSSSSFSTTAITTTTTTTTNNNNGKDDQPTESNNNTNSSSNTCNVFDRSKLASSSKTDNPDKVQASTEMHEKFINFKVLRESVIDKLLNRIPLQTLVNCVIDLTKQFSNVCPTLLPLLQSTNGNTSSRSVPSSSSMESQRNTITYNTAWSLSSSSSSATIEERLLNTPDAFEKTPFFASADVDPMERTCGFRTHIENKEPEVYDQVLLLQQQMYNSSLNNVNTTTSSNLWPKSKKKDHFERRDPHREVSHLLLRLYRFLVNRLSKNSTEQEKAEVFDLSPSSINPLVQIFSSEYLNWNTLTLVQIFFKHGKASPFIRRNLPKYPIHCDSTGYAFFKGSVINSIIPCYREQIIEEVGRCSLLHMLITNVRLISTAEKHRQGATCFRLSSSIPSFAAADPASQRLVLRHNSMIHAQLLLEFIRLKYGDEKLQEYMIMPTEIEMNTPCHLGVMHFRPEILFVMRHQFRAPKIHFTQINKNGFAPLDCHIYGEDKEDALRNTVFRKLLSKMIEDGEDALANRTLLSLMDDRVAIRFDGTQTDFSDYSSVFIKSYQSMTTIFDAKVEEEIYRTGRADDAGGSQRRSIATHENKQFGGGGTWGCRSLIYYKW